MVFFFSMEACFVRRVVIAISKGGDSREKESGRREESEAVVAGGDVDSVGD